MIKTTKEKSIKEKAKKYNKKTNRESAAELTVKLKK